MTASLPPLVPGATRVLAEFAANTDASDIPAAVTDKLKLHVLDGIGVCLFGSTLPWTRIVRDVALAEAGKPVAAIWGHGARTSLCQAVLVNSTAGHAFEMDDIHKESIVHPNSLSVPVALALAEADPSLTGRELMAAIACGYEVGTRVGNAATMALFLNGFHPQGTSGAFVAAVTAGRLLRLDAAQMQNAIGIVGSMGAGLMAAQEGAMVKRLHSGHAAQSGMHAAMLAARGFTGISDVVEAGYGGFLSSFGRTPAPHRLLAGLGSDWEAAKTGFKMYPNVTSIHAALDALQAVMHQAGLEQDAIDRIEVGCGHMTFVHTAWEYKPAGVTAAQMNMFYGLATMALHGDVAVEHYDEARIADPAVLDLIGRIAIREDPELEGMGAAYRHAARVRVVTRDGRTLDHEILNRRGSPENEVSRADVEHKFRLTVGDLLPHAARQRIEQLVAGFDDLPDLGELIGLLSTPL